MKQIIRNNRLLAIAFFTTFSVAAVLPAMGNDSNRVHPAVPVEMKFIGSLNAKPVFQLNFAGNAGQNEFTIIVRDEFDEVLYREQIRGEYFSKKFLLNTDELGDATILFEIICTQTRRTAVFKIDRDTRLVEDVVISQLR